MMNTKTSITAATLLTATMFTGCSNQKSDDSGSFPAAMEKHAFDPSPLSDLNYQYERGPDGDLKMEWLKHTGPVAEREGLTEVFYEGVRELFSGPKSSEPSDGDTPKLD